MFFVVLTEKVEVETFSPLRTVMLVVFYNIYYTSCLALVFSNVETLGMNAGAVRGCRKSREWS